MRNITLKAIGLAVLFVLGAVVPAQAAVMGPNGHYYEVVSAQGIDWLDANAAAGGMSYGVLPGHLATITSSGEDAFVNALLATANPTTGGAFGEAWAGGFQNPQDPNSAVDPLAGWSWVTGEAWGYANWSGGEPNDAYGPGSEQYLGLGWNQGFWNDEGALGNIAGYVVEYERTGVPEGTAGLAGILAIVGLFAAHRRTKKA